MEQLLRMSASFYDLAHFPIISIFIILTVVVKVLVAKLAYFCQVHLHELFVYFPVPDTRYFNQHNLRMRIYPLFSFFLLLYKDRLHYKTHFFLFHCKEIVMKLV